MREQDGVVKCRFFVPTSGNMKKKVGLYTLKGASLGAGFPMRAPNLTVL